MSTPLRQNLTFPVGRLLWGSVSQYRDKDRKGKPLQTKDGRARQEWAFGVGYEKAGTTHWAQTTWGAIAWAVGTGAFPQLFQPDGSLLPGRKFSWKIIDGDSTEFNEEGNRPCDNEGYPGHWVVAFKSAFAPSTWNADGTREVPADSIKPGMFVQVAGSIDSNGDAGKPGIYMNHAMVALAGFHPAGLITSGPNPASAGFGQGAKPANMQAVPPGALPGPSNGAPGAPPPPAAPSYAAPPPPAAPPQYAPPPPPAAPPQAVRPHAGILQPGAPPPPPAAVAPPPPPPPPVVTIQVTPKAGGATWDALRAAGWTEEVARAHGMIV